MNRRLAFALIAAFLPVLVLAYLYPERALDGSGSEREAISIAGAKMVVFVSDSCPHCADLKRYATKKSWELELLDITEPENQGLFRRLQERAPALQQGVPTIYVNGHVIQGYKTDETTGELLDFLYQTCRGNSTSCVPFDAFLETPVHVKVETAEGICTEGCEVNLDQFVFDFPIFGRVDLTLLSLPALSMLLGFLDGFNPCAMWVLITLLTLLINTRDMRKVWIIGATFLFVSGAVYYFFIAAWLNAFLLVGYNVWVQKAIGLVAIGGGGFYLYEALGKDPNACNVGNMQTKQRTIARMRHVLEITFWPAMIIGVAILAVSVNMIELVCTAGLPAVFTQILAFNDISNAARYGYMGLYILLYMIDDIVIFGIAVLTLHATGLTKKYARFTLIFGGVLIYLLGLLLIFAPEALVISV
ncbi:MAG: glutaredoxin domain-containing protein [Candidatus Peribacteraceae bacterium]|nr:glutaredoxin domain-containing protein [Candidatus Peribacteraceae bacterium]